MNKDMNEMKEMKVVKKDYKITFEFTYPDLGLPTEDNHKRYKSIMEDLAQNIVYGEMDRPAVEHFDLEGYTCQYDIEVKDSRD